MRRSWIVLFAAVAAIFLAGPVSAQTSEEIRAETRRLQAEILAAKRLAEARGALEAEMESLRETIAYLDGCLARVRPGHLVFVSPIGCAEYTHEHVSRMLLNGLLAGNFPADRLEAELTQVLGTSRESINAMRNQRAELVTMLENARRRWLDARAPAVTTPADPPRGAGAGCSDPTGTWSQSTDGVGNSNWTVRRGARGLEAVESGLGNATGPAQFSGTGLKIDFVTGGVAGTYEWRLDADCRQGRGQLVFTRGRSGTHSSAVRR